MLTQTDVRSTVLSEINTILLDVLDESTEFSGGDELYELGINSLALARLLIQLEAATGVDPFASEEVAVSDIRSVDDLVAAYESARGGSA
ncbi:phosphopantetheine binding protein [Herbihabitans rhizosphaerae]|uniref:Phosphopantetheine binding protein n=1 Tax=Herbihabitans rhizosphaerae TaxID=1872711 RepID=A0A4Q7L596_9PSEU|nr:phosphopantetheine-binding protein [Herbihabitans rhizosphaerae]RZS44444.1 phosphopantetheine binding protein [Herbihabitans rhizosphaerae]